MPASPTSATPEALREAFSHFPQGVVLIGAEVDGVPQGLVASTFTVGVSLDPPLVTFAVQHTSETWPLLRAAPRLGVSLMGRHQVDTTRRLASKDRDRRFDDVDIDIDGAGALTVRSTPRGCTPGSTVRYGPVTTTSSSSRSSRSTVCRAIRPWCSIRARSRNSSH